MRSEQSRGSEIPDQPFKKGAEIESTEVRFSILESEKVRNYLLKKTDGLMAACVRRGIEVLVFLDKSARPLSWLFRERFKLKYPDEAMPEIRYMNVGSTHGNERNLRDLLADRTSTEETQALRDLAYRGGIGEHAIPQGMKGAAEELNLGGRIREVYRDTFDGKEVYVVDDFSETGISMTAAMALIKQCAPDAYVSASSFVSMSQIREGDSVSDKVREYFPWYADPGATGVLELPETLITTSSLTAANIEKLDEWISAQKDSVISRLHRIVFSAKDDQGVFQGIDPQTVHQLYDAAKNYIHEHGEGEDGTQRVLAWLSHYVTFAEEGFKGGKGELTKDMASIRKELGDILWNLARNNVDSRREYSEYDRVVYDLRLALHELQKLDDLSVHREGALEKARKLRAEIIKLAQEGLEK